MILWAKAQAGIRLVARVGSGARADHPADEWSDIDLVLVASDPQVWLGSTDWLTAFGEVWFSFLECDPAGVPIERRALFAGGQDVDFIILPVESAHQGFRGTFVPDVASRGWQVLLDKGGSMPSIPVVTSPGPAQPPPFQEFTAVVHDFWFHAAWTAKKLRRGELWVAKGCCDEYMKRRLLRVLEWQAVEERGVDTWFNGRFLEQWAAPEVLEKLRTAFAYYDQEDIWRALRASMALFDCVAREVAMRRGYEYPAEKAEKVIAWVEATEQPSTK